MSLYRRGRIWWIELHTDQGRHRESSGTTDKKAAQEFHEKRKSELWRRDKFGEVRVTWGEAVALWMAKSTRGLPDRYRLRALELSASETLPLSPHRVEECLSSASPSSFNRTLALIVAIHNLAGLKPPKVARRKSAPGRTRWLTAEEWQRLRSALAKRSQVLCDAAAFTLETGLRENNVLELTWDQVDLKRRLAWLHGDQTKGKAPLGVPLNDAACAILASRRGIDKRWVFGNPDYPLTRASNRAWREARQEAKLEDVRWHDLRHTWASWHRMNGTSLGDLQDLGGWKSHQMVRRYAHMSPGHLADVAGNVRPVSMRYNAPKKGRKRTTTPTAGG